MLKMRSPSNLAICEFTGVFWRLKNLVNLEVGRTTFKSC